MSGYPAHDSDFEDVTLVEVKGDTKKGWEVKRSDGWSFGVQPDSPVVPAVGMSARFYGRGIGCAVRGLFLDGQEVYYRTEVEEEEHRQIQSYGADAAEWLRRWDAGDSVWSIEMGGLGPGYEQCIQITTAEILRHLLAVAYDHKAWPDPDIWKRDRDAIDAAVTPAIRNLGLSGAQWGAAMSLATKLYMVGPRSIMTNDQVKDRHIQVTKRWPKPEVLA